MNLRLMVCAIVVGLVAVVGGSQPLWAAAPIKLNGPLVAGGGVFFQQFSPDSSRVLYRADQTTDQVFEIFLVPSRGGTAVKINGPLVDGGSVSEPQFSPDGSVSSTLLIRIPMERSRSTSA